MVYRFASLLILLFMSLWACEQKEKYDPVAYLPPSDQKQFLARISRYIAKLPKRVTHEQKFDSKYDQYYREEMQKYRVQQYYISPDSMHFFLVNRPAPSLYEKKVAIGGRLKYSPGGEITEYEEVFRTWKLKDEELAQKGRVLFAAMVEKGNVEEFLPQNTQEDWVEFPDGRNYFDKASRQWRIKGQSDTVVYVR